MNIYIYTYIHIYTHHDSILKTLQGHGPQSHKYVHNIYKYTYTYTYIYIP